jgi:hypothetical protein
MMKPGRPTTFRTAPRLAGIAVLAAWSWPVAGQQVVPGASILDVEEEAEIRRYAVELIIFEYTDRATAGTEIFDPDEPPPLPEEAFIFDDGRGDPLLDIEQIGEDIAAADPVFSDTLPIDPLSAEPVADEPGIEDDGLFGDDTDVLLPPAEEVELIEIETHEQAGLKILPPEEYVLNAAYERLQTLDAYRPIMRFAWSQPTLEKELTTPITLRRLGDPPLRLDGTLTLYLSRFLHLVVDLELEEKTSARNLPIDNRLRRYGDERNRFGFESSFNTPSIFYRIEEDRIVRNNELRYYDHPRFGVLAKIWRVEEQEPVEPGTDPFSAPSTSSSNPD